MEFNYPKICSVILEDLTQKQKEIIARRFGLETGRKESLENIGQDFGLTRERIRQIEQSAIAKVKGKEDRDLKKLFFGFKGYLKRRGGLKREDILLAELSPEPLKNYGLFFLTVGEDFHRFSESEDFYSFWTIEKSFAEKIKAISDYLVDKLIKEKRVLPEQDLLNLMSERTEKREVFRSFIEILKKVEKGPLGCFGLAHWSEIKPKGAADKACLVLKKIGKPLHFKTVAELASQLEGDFCKKKMVFPQTLHNELIRDNRFVLVGRGIYGLAEWGYKPGTVRDIIRETLSRAKEALSREDIVAQVLNQRLVKENTILLNLQDRELFQRDSQGRYSLRAV